MTIEMKMDQRYEQGRKKGRNEGEQMYLCLIIRL